jgi:hypothetical protein
MKRLLAHLCLLSVATFGCAGSDFAGGGATQAQKKARSSDEDADEPDKRDKDLGGVDKDESNGSTPLGQTGDDGVIVRDTPELGEKVVIFGGDQFFHIGDGEFKDSTCLFEIGASPLSGTTFRFEFDVLEDTSLVEISVNLCGVDIIDTNFASIQSGTSKLQEKRLIRDAFLLAFQPQVLNKGRYSVVIESRNGSQDRQWTVEDHDDYMVKQVTIKSDKGVQRGNVSAN